MAAADYTSVVQQLYISYFGRPADYYGLQNFTSQLAAIGAPTTVAGIAAAVQAADLSGKPTALSTLVEGFNSAAESASLYGTGNDIASISKFVTAIFNNVLNRDPQLSGLTFYVNAIESGQLSKAAAALVITNGALTNTSAQGLLDAATVNNKNSVATDFTATLSANPSTAASAINAYSGQAAAATARGMLKAVDNTTNVTAYHATVVSTESTLISNLNTGTTTALTTGVDSIIATGSNQAVVGTFGGAAGTATFTTGDTVNGVANLKLADGSTGGTGALPAVTTVSNIASLNVVSSEAVTVNAAAAGWTGIAALNVTSDSAGANGDTVTASGTTAVTVSDTASASTHTLAVDGGSTVSVIQTNTDVGATPAIALGDIKVGASTAATGAVTVTATESVTQATDTAGNISVTGGTAVMINSTVNAAVAATAATTGITVSGATGAVTVNNLTNVTDKAQASDVITGDAVAVTGGTTVVVNNTVTTSAAAALAAVTHANAPTVTEGDVTVLDGGTATSVTVNQAAATAQDGAIAQNATVATVVPGGPGYSAVTTVAAQAAAAAVPGVLGVTAGTVFIAGAAAGNTLADSSATITSVALTNYATAEINSSVLSNVTLGGVGGGLTIDNVGSTPFTTLALNMNHAKETGGITINGNSVKTLNVTTGGTGSSTIASIADTALTTLNIAGSQTLKMTTVTPTLTTIAVTGAAGFSGDVSGLGAALTSFTTTSSGTITATLDAAHQTFVGSSGQDVITIAVDATKTITGGSAANNELILSTASTNYTAAKTGAKVTGFTTLGVSDATAGHVNAYDMKNIFTGFKAIDLVAGDTSGAGSTAFVNVATGTTLSIDSNVSGSGNVTAVEGSIAASVLYQVANNTGSTDSVALTLGTGATEGITVAGLMLEDANAVGIGTINLVSNGDGTSGNLNTITTLIDNGLSNLNVSGSADLTITTLNEATTQATTFTIGNTGGAVTITTFTDANLGGLNFTGTGSSTITELAGVTGHIVSISNTGTQTATIGTFDADSSLSTLTLSGNIALNADATAGAAGLPAAATATGATSGVTVAAGTDNAHINLTLNGALATATDSITVGNANNYITDNSIAGTVNVTVGSGANLIDLHTGGTGGSAATETTYSGNVTLGAHTNTSALFNVIEVGVTGLQTAGYSNTVTGAVKGDEIVFFSDTAQSKVVSLTTAQQTAVTAAASLAAAITLAYTDAHTATGHAAHDVLSFTYGGDTYVINDTADTGAFVAGTDSIVHLVGSHTIAQVTAGAHATFSIAS